MMADNTNTMFCWGHAEYNQLGITPADGSDTINEPTQINAFSLLPPIKDVVCGEDHTVFVCCNGSVYSCGRNDHGQLGHDSIDGKMAGIVIVDKVSRLEDQPVRLAACGQNHSVFLTNTGRVYTCGDKSVGQLGVETSGEELQHAVPMLVTTLSSAVVVQVACGFRHTLALSQVGALYSWGSNSHGQLGIGNNPAVASSNKPQLIASLRGLAFTQIAAGGNSSFALTVSGALFGWGRNNCGQLGVGNTDDYWYPVLCKSMRSLRPKYISCGTYHVAVLTEDGGVFTFGCGTHGQLGHGSFRNEFLPHKIFELMGSTVTQVACGSCHTMALLAPSGQMYMFGAAVGSDSEPSMTCRLYGPNVPTSGPISKLPKADNMETRIFCGSNQCYILSSPSVEFSQAKYLIDRRVTDPASQVLTITEDLVQQLCCTSPVERPPSSVMERLEAILSSDSCWNGSFLTPGEQHSCTSKNPGVDLVLARRVLGLLHNYTSQNKTIFEKIQDILGKQLLYALPSSPADVDALRIYILLPQSPLFDSVQYYATVICPFAQAVTRLDKMASKVLDNWYSSFEASFLLGQVTTYKKVVVHILLLPEPTSNYQKERRLQQLTYCLEMLKKLNAINESHDLSKISYDEFHITELREKLNITEDYVAWLRPEARKGICFCNYPFVFNGEMKSALLQTEAMFQMQAAVEEATHRNFAAMFMPINPVNPLLVLQVRRSHLVHDVVSQLQMHQKLDFKKPLKVVFIDEEGQDGGGLRKVIFIGEDAVDEGGVRKEFFLLLAREILDPKYGMFKQFEDSNLIWFDESSFEEPATFNLIGVLCGLAIYNFTIVDLHFPLALYKKLLRRKVTVEDLAELQPTVARSLQHMLKYEEDDFGDVFSLTFEITKDCYGSVVTEELIPGGSKVPVTKENKQQYVDCYVEYVFYKAIDAQFQPFSEGFHRVCGGRVLDLFHPKELQAMVVGNELYDWEAFDKNTEYKGEYHRLHNTIVHFWTVFHSLTQEEKKKFLLFLSGSDRIPIMGMQAVKMTIQPVGGGEQFLPVAHTCFNLLDLPKYSTAEILRAKLLQAIQQSEGFALI